MCTPTPALGMSPVEQYSLVATCQVPVSNICSFADSTLQSHLHAWMQQKLVLYASRFMSRDAVESSFSSVLSCDLLQTRTLLSDPNLYAGLAPFAHLWLELHQQHTQDAEFHKSQSTNVAASTAVPKHIVLWRVVSTLRQLLQAQLCSGDAMWIRPVSFVILSGESECTHYTCLLQSCFYSVRLQS